MLHVDDGQLHAYLDGELGNSDEGRAEEVERHLAACSECRTRLGEARRLRDQAHTVLHDAGPADLWTPSWESIAARSATPPPRRSAAWTGRSFRTATAAAWAASILLSLGIGWYVRGVWVPPAREVAAVEASAEAAPRRDPADTPVAGDPVPAVALAAPESLESPDDDPRTTKPAEPALLDEPGSDAHRETVARGRVTTESGQAIALQEHVVALEEVVVTGQAGTVERRRAASSARLPRTEAMLLSDDVRWEPVERAEAERRLGEHVFAVDGLPIVGTEMAMIDGGLAVRTRQRSNGGTMLVLVQRRGAPADPASRHPGR